VADRDLDLPEEQLIVYRQGNSFLIRKNGQFADIP